MRSTFMFYQMSSKPELVMPYFNVIGGRLHESTVTLNTLKHENIDVPSYPSLNEWKAQQQEKK